MNKLARPTYTAEFKLEAAQLVVDQNYSVKEAAQSMGVSKSAMDKWVRQLKKERSGEASAASPLTHFIKKPLFGFVGDVHEDNIQGIPFSLLDYIELVDWSGGIIREDKRGAISNQRSQLLSILGLDNETWLSLASSFGKDYHGAVGSLEALATYASNTGKRWIASKNELRLH